MITVVGERCEFVLTISEAPGGALQPGVRRYIRDATGDDLIRAGWHHCDFNKLIEARHSAEKELERYKSVVRLLNPKLHELIESAGKIE